ncbi:hypothetical protein EJ02DRAFT_144652 [Clathrospora elynae]|uniref:Arrestin-like N-terminal domain-containing protein n=1 Tax=Clathrospora elynae TaxID=706981 RepID=A0A6A5SRB6_9PLEO|nr:hypothetical protein EJ02DRAFT_144652 [Clathrospora elynae]
MTVSALRVIVDGDSNKEYRRGDKVTGRVILVVEEQAEVDSLKVVFAGSCVTKTTRPLHVYGNTDASPRCNYEEMIRIFVHEKELVPHSTLGPKKYSWMFEFVFPELTEQRYKRLVRGANYPREPHALPPSFQLKTSVPGGAAQISYFVQARLILSGSKETKRCKHTLRYHPIPPVDILRDAKAIPTILYGQIWKPTKEKKASWKAIRQMLSGVSMSSSPRIVPTLHHPTQIAPGQHIPLSLSLFNSRDPLNHAQRECIMDSFTVTISTYSTTICGHSMTHPEDVVSKHVTCIAKTNMNKPIPFNQTRNLTSDFRLIDDMECVPTFKTYTITRRYALGVIIGIKFNDQHFTIRSNISLEILPRMPCELLPAPLEERENVDQLPRYTPREPEREFAPPDYDSTCALSRTPSSSKSLSLPGSRSSDLFSGASRQSTAASTPVSEMEQPRYERVMVQT